MKRWALALFLLPSTAWAGGEFSYLEPGDLISGSGSGAADSTVYAPGMRYPMEEGPSYPNSQVWGHGGGSGPGGGQCDTENYSYPWRDNYCETRSWDMPLCPSGVGHQGQDIRPGTCEDGVHWNVSSEAGTVTNVGSFSVYVTAADGTRFDYLHGTGNVVGSGQSLTKGERINRVSNEFGGTPTTIHLHYNIRQDVAGVGFVYVSPYMSLVESYEDLLGIGTDVDGAASQSECSAIVGWAQDVDDPEASIDVQVYFDGTSDDPDAVGVEVAADEYREELCESLGSCEHGFTLELPLSLRDGQLHSVNVYGLSAAGGEAVELESSADFTCDPPAVPDGVRRLIPGPAAIAAWGLSPFYDAASIEQADVDAIEVGPTFPETPMLVRADDGDDAGVIWWVDPDFRRRVPDPEIAAVWGLDLDDVQTWSAAMLEEVPQGTPLREDVFMVQAPDGLLYVIDDAQCDPDDDECEPTQGTGTDGESDAGTGGGGGGDDDGDASDSNADSNGGVGTGGASNPAFPDSHDEFPQGCGCTGGGTDDPSWLWVFALLPVFRRRRTRTPSP